MKLVKLRTFQLKTIQNPYILGCSSKLRDIKVDINNLRPQRHAMQVLGLLVYFTLKIGVECSTTLTRIRFDQYRQAHRSFTNKTETSHWKKMKNVHLCILTLSLNHHQHKIIIIIVESLSENYSSSRTSVAANLTHPSW